MFEIHVPDDVRELAKYTACKVIVETQGHLEDLEVGTNAIIIAILKDRHRRETGNLLSEGIWQPTASSLPAE